MCVCECVCVCVKSITEAFILERLFISEQSQVQTAGTDVFTVISSVDPSGASAHSHVTSWSSTPSFQICCFCWKSTILKHSCVSVQGLRPLKDSAFLVFEGESFREAVVKCDGLAFGAFPGCVTTHHWREPMKVLCQLELATIRVQTGWLSRDMELFKDFSQSSQTIC